MAFCCANADAIDQFNKHKRPVKLMRNCNRKINLALLALIAAGLLAVPPEKSQAQENFAWVTNTDGLKWKKLISCFDYSYWEEGYILCGYLEFDESEKPKIASILVPEHASILRIFADGCVNLTNIVLNMDEAKVTHAKGSKEPEGVVVLDWHRYVYILARDTALRNITCSKTMRDNIILTRSSGWWYQPPIQWTELEPEPPRIEIRTHATGNGQEVEVVWKEGTLQIADAVNGEYRDHIGTSPLRFPLVVNSKDKQFFRIRRSESPITEEPPTPQTSGGGR